MSITIHRGTSFLVSDDAGEVAASADISGLPPRWERVEPVGARR
jgi:hypothetical protein